MATTMNSVLTATLLVGLLQAGVSAAAVPAQVEVLANACSVCHGTDGHGGGKIPKLNSELEVFDFIVTMKGYAAGTERATVMDRIAKGLTEDEIRQLAEYFATLE